MNKKNNRNYLEMFFTFFKIGIVTFGGGLAMIPILNRELIEKRKWATEEELLDYFAISNCTPGVIAVNTSTFIGYKRAGWLGALFSTLGVITPSITIICIVAMFLSKYMTYPIVANIINGIKVSVAAMLLMTIINLIKKGVKDAFGLFLFFCAIALSVFTPLSTIFIIIIITSITLLKIKLYPIFFNKENIKK